MPRGKGGSVLPCTAGLSFTSLGVEPHKKVHDARGRAAARRDSRHAAQKRRSSVLFLLLGAAGCSRCRRWGSALPTAAARGGRHGHLPDDDARARPPRAVRCAQAARQFCARARLTRRRRPPSVPEFGVEFGTAKALFLLCPLPVPFSVLPTRAPVSRPTVRSSRQWPSPPPCSSKVARVSVLDVACTAGVSARGPSPTLAAPVAGSPPWMPVAGLVATLRGCAPSAASRALLV